jgi:hypothetical protein
MRRVIIALFTTLSLSLCAQNEANSRYFEGSISYSVDLTGEMSAMLKTFLPESMTFRFRKMDMAMTIEGGIMAKMGNMIFLGEKSEAYLIDRENKKAMRVMPKSKEFKPSPPVVVKESETQNIAGFPCSKYKIATRDKEGNAKISYVWATEKLNLLKSNNSEGAADQFKSFMIKGVKGIPLKMVNTQANLGTVTLTATRVQPEKLADSYFCVPVGYSIEEFDPMKAGFH